MDQCSVVEARVTVTPTGIMNATLFINWLQWFAEGVPATVK